MIRFLPFILIPVLVIAGLGYWRFGMVKQSQPISESAQQVQDAAPVEVPKTLPGASVEDRVKTLEDVIAKLTPQINSLKSAGTQIQVSSSLESRLSDVESAVTDLKARVSALEKSTPGTTSVSQPTIYIPMGSTSGPWTNNEWALLSEYEIPLNPSNYPGYTGMVLEVNFRMVDPTGIGSIRLYNVTDSSVVSSQLDTSSTNFGLFTTNTFKLASGQKTYKLQIKTTGGKEIYIQSARIKVNF